jgi:hypothetical protein
MPLCVCVPCGSADGTLLRMRSRRKKCVSPAARFLLIGSPVLAPRPEINFLGREALPVADLFGPARARRPARRCILRALGEGGTVQVS